MHAALIISGVGASVAPSRAAEPTLQELEAKLERDVAEQRRKAAEAARAEELRRAREAEERRAADERRIEDERLQAEAARRDAEVAEAARLEAERLARQVTLKVSSDAPCALSLNGAAAGNLSENLVVEKKLEPEPAALLVRCVSTSDSSIAFEETRTVNPGDVVDWKIGLANDLYGGGCSADFFRYASVEADGRCDGFGGGSLRIEWKRVGPGQGELKERLGGFPPVTTKTKYACVDGTVLFDKKPWYDSLEVGHTKIIGGFIKGTGTVISRQQMSFGETVETATITMNNKNFVYLVGAPLRLRDEYGCHVDSLRTTM